MADPGQFILSRLNPVNFYLDEFTDYTKYQSRRMDDYAFFNQRKSYQQLGYEYTQKWIQADTIALQFRATFSSINCRLKRCGDDFQVFDQIAVQRRKDRFDGFYIYENYFSLTNVPEGRYYIELLLGNTTTLVSEPMEIFESLPGSYLLEYRNTRWFAEYIFETGITPSFRVEADLNRFAPDVARVGYEDQQANFSILSARPFRGWNFVMGPFAGVPDWVAEKANWIWACNQVALDGQPMSVAEDGKLERIEFDLSYGMAAWSIKVQEGYNRSSKYFNVPVDPNQRLIVTAALDSTLFGDISEQAGNNIITIESIE